MPALANVFVNVQPQFTGFNQSLRAHMAAVPTQNVSVNVNLKQGNVNNVINNFSQTIAKSTSSALSSTVSTFGNGLKGVSGQLFKAIAADPAAGVAGAAVGLVIADAMASTIGAAISAAIITGAGVAGIGAGLAIAFQDPRVKSAGKDLADSVKSELSGAAEPFIESLLDVIPYLKTQIQSLKPDLSGIFSTLAPELKSLASGLVGGIKEAMPGIKQAIQASKPFLEDLSKGFVIIGAAIGDFFQVISSNKKGAEEFFRGLIEFAAGFIKVTGIAIAVLSEQFTWMVSIAAKAGQFLEGILGPARKLADVLALADPTNVLFRGLAAGLDVADDATLGFNKAMNEMATGFDFNLPKIGFTTDGFKNLADTIRQARDAQIDMLDAQQAITDHATALGKAVTDSAAAIIQSNIAVRNSRDSAADADYSYNKALQAEKDAQKGVTQARKDAAKQLIDLRDAALQAGDAEESSYDKLTAAQARVSGGDTSREALAALAAAQDDHTSAVDKNHEAQAALTDAQRKGIEGSDLVVAAKQRLKDADHALHDAEIADRNAHEAVTKALKDQTAAIAANKTAKKNAKDFKDENINTPEGREHIKLDEAYADAKKIYDKDKDLVTNFTKYAMQNIGKVAAESAIAIGKVIAQTTTTTTKTEGAKTETNTTGVFGRVAQFIHDHWKDLVAGPIGLTLTRDLPNWLGQLSNNVPAVQSFAQKSKDALFNSFVNPMSTFFNTAVPALFTTLGTTVGGSWDGITAKSKASAGIVMGIVGGALAALNKVGQPFGVSVASLDTPGAGGAAAPALKKTLASGGKVDGPGSETSDSIPAMLSKNEWVINAAASNHYGHDFMHALNNKKVPKLAAGGSVDEIIAVAKKAGVPLGQLTTTGGKHVGDSYHYKGEAVDFGGGSGTSHEEWSKTLAAFFYKNYGHNLLEEIHAYDDALDGYYIKNGADGTGIYNAGTKRGHRDHVHIAALPGFSGLKGGFDISPGISTGASGVSQAALTGAIAPYIASLASQNFLGAMGSAVLNRMVTALTGGANAALGTGTPGAGILTGASMFGGPGDPGTGTHGYHGDSLIGKMAFAELSKNPAARDFAALGGLPYKQKAHISYNGRTVDAEKLDVGAGGSDVNGHHRSVDLWYQLADRLGFKGTGLVNFQTYDQGGWLTDRAAGINSTGKPEAILNPDESEAFVKMGKTGASKEFHFHVHGDINKPVDGEVLMKQFEFMARRL